MSERLKEAVLKTVESLRVPWVRIPPSPLENFFQFLLAFLKELWYNNTRVQDLERWPRGRRRTPAKGVYGWLYRGFKSHSLRFYAPIAQLDRVFGYEPWGRGFESLLAHWMTFWNKMIRKTKAVKQRDLLSGFLCLRMAERYLGKSDLLCWIDSKKVFSFC